jgi:hypothetical protein
MKLATNAENSFIQRVLVGQRYGVNCSRLTLWEYLILVEQALKKE